MMRKEYSILNAITLFFNKIKKSYDSDWLITNTLVNNNKHLSTDVLSQYKVSGHLYGKHTHNCFEICLMIEGSCTLNIGNEIINVNKDEACLIFPDIQHNEIPKNKEKYLAVWINFDAKAIKLHLSGKSSDNELFTTDYKILEIDYMLYNMILFEIEKEDERFTKWSVETIKLNIMQLLIIILNSLEEANKKSPNSANDWQQCIVYEVIDYIKANYNKSCVLSDISQQVGVSNNHLNAIFKKATGVTIINYLNDYKILEAKKHLTNSNLKIKEIAFLLGYYDQYHFSKTFKKHTGVSPSKYRS